MKTKFFIAAFATLALASCKQELEPQESSTALDVSAPAASTASPQAVPATAQPQTMAQPTVQTTTAAPQTATVAKGMNPPHGQPGHRCDIAVGAPLNSPPSASPATKAAPMTVTPTQTGTAIAKEVTPGTPALLSTPTTTTAPGMNPPHGQAGHRCDIAVGAPLSSAPTSTAKPIEIKQ